MDYKKINKRLARKLYENFKPFIMVPGDFRLDSWAACFISSSDHVDDSFDTLYNSFCYYNGSISKKVSFWVVTQLGHYSP